MTGYNPPKTIADRGLHIPVRPLEDELKRERRQARREKIENAAIAAGAAVLLATVAYHIESRFDNDRFVDTPVAPVVAEDMYTVAEDMQQGQVLTEADRQHVQQMADAMQVKGE